jgi:hypothetical protein
LTKRRGRPDWEGAGGRVRRVGGWCGLSCVLIWSASGVAARQSLGKARRGRPGRRRCREGGGQVRTLSVSCLFFILEIDFIARYQDPPAPISPAQVQLQLAGLGGSVPWRPRGAHAGASALGYRPALQRCGRRSLHARDDGTVAQGRAVEGGRSGGFSPDFGTGVPLPDARQRRGGRVGAGAAGAFPGRLRGQARAPQGCGLGEGLRRLKPRPSQRSPSTGP